MDSSVRSIDSATSSTMDISVDLKKKITTKAISKTKSKRRKPNGKPKRPLSAYNLFFKSERDKLVQSNQKVGFANMAKLISSKWKELDTEDRKEFVAGADVEQKKYRSAVKDWKASHMAEMETHLLNSRTQQFAGASLLGPMLSQLDSMALQRLVMEHQMYEQQNMMQVQMQNAVNLSAGGRRMSMPNMGTSPSTTSTAQMFSNESVQLLLQQLQHQQQSQAIAERRFSMPLNTTSSVIAAQQHMSSSFNFSIQDSYSSVDLTQSSYADSTDESSLDDETADLLINMPIMDMVEEQLKLQEPMQVPSSVAAITTTPRRSSMPILHKKREECWSSPTPLMTGRRLSMPQLSDEMKEMQDILDMLDDDTPAFYSAMNSAA